MANINNTDSNASRESQRESHQTGEKPAHLFASRKVPGVRLEKLIWLLFNTVWINVLVGNVRHQIELAGCGRVR